MYPYLGIKSQSSPIGDTKLHTEIRDVPELYEAHSHKIYFSGPLVRKCVRHLSKPTAIDEWVEVWAQLGGTCLSIWVVKEIEAACKEGREVPPSYTTITDSYTQIQGAIRTPATSYSLSYPKIYANIMALTTAGSDLNLFSCPDPPSLVSWITAVRLAAWERSRLEEIYTASLLRTALPMTDVPTTLLDGKLEGWATTRISGQTTWRKVWLVVQAGVAAYDPNEQSPPAPGPDPATPAAPAGTQNSTKGKRLSDIFSFQTTSTKLPTLPMRLLSIYDSPKAKQKKKPPLFTMSIVCQAYAVYPERPELINVKGSLIKVVGVGVTAEVQDGRGQDASVLIHSINGSAEMLGWIVALHDAFELYGRPKGWNWDHRNPVSLLFGYPGEAQKAELFLDRSIAESVDPREDSVTKNHASLKNLLKKHRFSSQGSGQ